MKKKKAGFLTIGQSPRDDIIAEIQPLLSPGIEIYQAGALDDLNSKEIFSLRPDQDDLPLITRLRDGKSVIIGRKKILPLLLNKINELKTKKIDLIVLLCTENFVELTSKGNLILPFELIKKEVINLSPAKVIVFIPLKEQKDGVREKWLCLQDEVSIEVLNPYEKFNDLEKLASSLTYKMANLIIFDCFGYSISLSQRIAKRLGLPPIIPRLLIANQLNQEL